MAARSLTAFLNDPDSRRVVRRAHSDARIERGNVREAERQCRRTPSPEVLLVDLDGEQNPMPHVAGLLEVCRPETVILATGSENNVSLANELYRGGVFLYLPKPLDINGLSRGIEETDALLAEASERPRIQGSRLFSVVGDGMGTTTVTALLARQAEEMGRYVVCMDLDAEFGSLALAMDTQPNRGLSQALQRTDDSSVDHLLTPVTPRIHLVAQPVDQVTRDEKRYDALPTMVESFANQAHVILVCGINLELVAMLQPFTTNHLIVFEPTPSGVSIAARWLRLLQNAPSALIVNQTRPLPDLISREQMSDAFGGREPDLALPYIRPMARAMALGEPERALPRRTGDAVKRFLMPLVGAGGAAEEA